MRGGIVDPGESPSAQPPPVARLCSTYPARPKTVGLEDLDIITVHYRHARPTVATLTAFFRHYPNTRITLVDNSGGSCRAETEVLPHFAADADNIRILVNPATEHGALGPLSHGGGIDLAVAETTKPYLVSMEADTFVLKRGGLEFLAALVGDGADWAGLAQKPYGGEFASFSPAFAIFRVELLRRCQLSFRRRNRSPEDISSNDLLMRHHLDVAQRLQAGGTIDYMDGKPPDTYRRPVRQIIDTEIQHLGYFDTGEWVHRELLREGHNCALFEPLDSICHVWGSRDESLFLENFTHRLPQLDINDYLPDALRVQPFCELDLECLGMKQPDGQVADRWRAMPADRAELTPSATGVEVRVPAGNGHVHVALGPQPLDQPVEEATGAALAPSTEYRLRCESQARGDNLSAQLWAIEYGNGRRLQHHNVPLATPVTELKFQTDAAASSFRVVLRFTGEGTMQIHRLALWSRGVAL